eukprot:197092_1
MSTNHKWHTLLSFPNEDGLSQPFMVSNDEFVVASNKTCFTKGKAYGIYKFNINKNEWIKIFDYDKNFNCVIWSSAYDNINKLLYACNAAHYPPKVQVFDLKNKTVASKENDTKYSKFIYVENKLHTICDKHYTYDTKDNTLCIFDSVVNFDYFDLVYLKTKNSIFAFGGWDRKYGRQNKVHKFSLYNFEWNELIIKMPIKLSHFGLQSTCDEKYIIILGGMVNGFYVTDDIFIYDIRNNIFVKSKIKCPEKGT